ncbi:MAG: hypothetical protein JW712_04025 [Dehalococcoidales bacterium]|nr:hypothetical protein [Dehalococcoidales bacterium]
MTAVLRISRYYLMNNTRLYIFITAALLLLHIIASKMVDVFVGVEREAGIITPLVLVAAWATGATIFPSSFRYLSSQGISRKTYWLMTWLNLAVTSLICALLVAIYYAIMSSTVVSIGSITLYEGIYHTNNIAGLIVWEFSALFLLATIAWLERVIAYRTGRLIRIIIGVAFVIGWILLAYFNSATGAFLQAVGEFFTRILGLYGAVPNPYIAVLTFLAIAVVLSGIIFLLIRRAPITE